ncbi:hypothetical protein [Pseudomonas phage D6]|nr:hypothetical protein [Pseudomonas phage D6]
MNRNDAELNSFRIHLTHQVMHAAFTFGPKAPMSSWIANGRQISKITCTMEANEAIYDVNYVFMDKSQSARVVIPFKDDPVQKYICNRFNISIFGETVIDVARIDVDELMVDGEVSDCHQNNAQRNFFREEVVRMATEKAIN